MTHVATWSGFAYVAFVTDLYSRRIVDGNVAANLRAESLPLQALCMAAWDAGGDLTGLTHHLRPRIELLGDGLRRPDRRTRKRSCTETVGDSYDNALAEVINNLYKTELLRKPGFMVHGRTRRARHRRIRVVVEQPAPSGRTRHAHTPRSRAGVPR